MPEQELARGHRGQGANRGIILGLKVGLLLMALLQLPCANMSKRLKETKQAFAQNTEGESRSA